jgi:hypothetical protein
LHFKPFSGASRARHGTARDLSCCPIKPCWLEGNIMKLNAKFDTRREAEMTVERLVQQFEIDRAKVVVTAGGDENTAGIEEDGSDNKAGEPSPEARGDAELNGKVVVTVEVADDVAASEVREAFAEFDASEQAVK